MPDQDTQHGGDIGPDKSAGLSSAAARLYSCRWRATPHDGVAPHCAHRDVLPLAGTTGFNPEAWCPDCVYYKLRRTPKKREPLDEYGF